MAKDKTNKGKDAPSNDLNNKPAAENHTPNAEDKTQMTADKDVTMLTLTHVGFLPSGVRISVSPDDVNKYISTGRARLLKEGE